MVIRHTKRSSTSLVIRKMHIKPQWAMTSYFLKWISSEKHKECWWGCGEQVTLVHCWWECKLVQPLWKTVWRFLKKTKNRTTVSWVYIWKKKRTPIWKDTCIPMFIAGLFTIAKIGSNLSVHQQLNGLRCDIYILNGIWLSHKKRMKFCHLKQHGWTWRVFC